MASRRGADLDTAVDSGRPARGRADLLLVIGAGQIRSVPFAGDALVIGRADDCDVVLDHPKLSRRHARVTRAPTLAVQDLGSTNGTTVAGTARTDGPPATLRPGEAFHIGPYAFVVTSASVNGASTGRTGSQRLEVADPARDRVTPLVREIAESGVNVLVQGETGVGKDVLATTLHELSRRRGPFRRINCAALSESLLEAELFGYEKGAFTDAIARKEGLLEAAAGGTAFLDEIGELPLTIQSKLLHAIEAREVTRLGATRPIAIDARFVAATNRDLVAEVTAGRFRSDLFFRIDGVTLHIPPLRERATMIAPLALGFLREAASRLGKREVMATTEVLAALEARPWPGNVRELKAVIERAVLLARDGKLGVRHLAFAAVPGPPPVPLAGTAGAPTPQAPADLSPGAPPAPDLSSLTAEQLAERAHLVAVLAECIGNQTRAARKLGIPRTTLTTKLVALRIPRPRT